MSHSLKLVQVLFYFFLGSLLSSIFLEIWLLSSLLRERCKKKFVLLAGGSLMGGGLAEGPSGSLSYFGFLPKYRYLFF